MTTTDALRARIVAATRPAPSLRGAPLLAIIGAGCVVAAALWGLT